MNQSKKLLGSLQRVGLRDFWEDEACEFTPWLAEEQNLRLLGEAIGMELELEATESRVGAFKADIVARESGTDDRVIIENQLRRTNHDHLGKLLTYASGLNARAVVWIASEIADEHRRALDWLNEITGEQFSLFGLEIELWRIGNSEPAPKFNLVCRPNDWAKSLTGSERLGESTETTLTQLEFWRGFVDFARSRGTTLSLRKPRPRHWYSLAVGRSRFSLSLSASTRLRRVGCELYIHHEQSKRAFTLLQAQRPAIEAELGSLEWQELPHRRDCRIVNYRPGAIDDRAQWPELHSWLMDRAEAFHRMFSKRVRELELEDDEAEDGSEAG